MNKLVREYVASTLIQKMGTYISWKELTLKNDVSKYERFF